MNADAPIGIDSSPDVGAWRHIDLVILCAFFYAVVFTPIGRDEKSLLLALAGAVGLSRTIAWYAVSFVGRRWLNGRDRIAYLSAYFVSLPVTCFVGYVTVMIARRSAE